MKTNKIIVLLVLLIFVFGFVDVLFGQENEGNINAIPSETEFRLKQIQQFYKNNPNKEFEEYGLIYPTALIFRETKISYYFSLDLEVSPQYHKLSKSAIFNLLITLIPRLHFQKEVFRQPMMDKVKSAYYNMSFDNIYELYEFAAMRIDKDHEQDFFVFEHMIFFWDLILNGYYVYLSTTAANFYEEPEKKSSYAYFKYTLDIISTYKMFMPYPVHGKKSPLLRSLDMITDDWEKSFAIYYESDFLEK
ncbi:hypothetical protein J7L48_01615 [bacterium]|nr:hypothetical protein [bacterium]